jgi:hypothetical protein
LYVGYFISSRKGKYHAHGAHCSFKLYLGVFCKIPDALINEATRQKDDSLGLRGCFLAPI